MTLKNSDADVMNDTVLDQSPGEVSSLSALSLFAMFPAVHVCLCIHAWHFSQSFACCILAACDLWAQDL